MVSTVQQHVADGADSVGSPNRAGSVPAPAARIGPGDDAQRAALRERVATSIDGRRRALGLSVSRLAGEANCSRATINEVLVAKVGVRLRTLGRIADALECEIDALVVEQSSTHVRPPPYTAIDGRRSVVRTQRDRDVADAFLGGAVAREGSRHVDEPTLCHP